MQFTRVYITDRIADALTQLSHLTSLELSVSVYNSLAFLKASKHLIDLTLSESCDANGIGELRQIKSLRACNLDNGLIDLTVLKPLRDLEALSFYSTDYGGDYFRVSKIRDVSPLKRLPKLRSFSVDYVGEDLTCFPELKQLQNLYLGTMSASYDLSPLGELTQLEMLELSVDSRYRNSRVMNLASLASLTNLTHISISHNKVRSLEPLRNMKKLQALYCGGNQIRTVKPLEKLTELQILDLAGNSIRSIADLGNLSKLTALALGENPIQDFSPIQGLPYYQSNWETDDRITFNASERLRYMLP